MSQEKNDDCCWFDGKHQHAVTLYNNDFNSSWCNIYDIKTI